MAEPIHFPEANAVLVGSPEDKAAGTVLDLPIHRHRDADGQDQLVDVSKTGMVSRLKSAARRAGLTIPRLIHGTRHHVGTVTLAQSGDIRMVQGLLGHADIKSTLRYSHALDSGLRAQLESRNSPVAPDPDAMFSTPKQRRARTRR